MWPWHIPIGPFAITPVETFALIGVAVATVFARRRVKPLGMTWGDMFDVSLAGLIGGAVGAKLFYAIPLVIRGVSTVGELASDWSGGSAMYGGWIGGTAVGALAARIKKFPPLSVIDGAATGFPLGFAIGKIGCFLAGCCYGVRTDAWWGVSFAPGSLAYRTQYPSGLQGTRALPVVPTALIELAAGLALWGLLMLFERVRNRRPGEVYLAFLTGYSLWRFGIEFLRDDPGRHVFGAAALSDSQIAALILLGLAGVFWLVIRLRRPPPAANPSTAAPGQP